MKNFLILILCFALVGCGSAREVQTETVEVLVPVSVPCPIPPELDRPDLPLRDLAGQDADPESVMRTYVSSTWLLMGYVHELEELLEAYRSDRPQPKIPVQE